MDKIVVGVYREQSSGRHQRIRKKSENADGNKHNSDYDCSQSSGHDRPPGELASVACGKILAHPSYGAKSVSDAGRLLFMSALQDAAMTALLRCGVIVSVLAVALVSAQAQLRGHGGPVRALAISPDGSRAISGSFDTSAIRWSLARNVAEQVMRFHDDAVNAVVWLKDGRIATAGADAHIAIWSQGQPQPDKVLDGHGGPIAALAESGNGTMLASASWDHTVRLWPLVGGAPRVLEVHTQAVNSVAFTPDGRNVVSAGYDAALRFWPLAGGPEITRTLPAPLNSV